MESQLASLREMIHDPVKHAAWAKQGVTPPSGIIFHGPPGTGLSLGVPLSLVKTIHAHPL